MVLQATGSMSILSLGEPKVAKLVKGEFLRFKAQSGSIRLIQAHSGSFRLIQAHSGSFRLIQAQRCLIHQMPLESNLRWLACKVFPRHEGPQRAMHWGMRASNAFFALFVVFFEDMGQHASQLRGANTLK